jgi:hypothetical protein
MSGVITAQNPVTPHRVPSFGLPALSRPWTFPVIEAATASHRLAIRVTKNSKKISTTYVFFLSSVKSG